MAIEEYKVELTGLNRPLDFTIKNMPIPRIGETICVRSDRKKSINGIYKVKEVYYHVREGEPIDKIPDELTQVQILLDYKHPFKD